MAGPLRCRGGGAGVSEVPQLVTDLHYKVVGVEYPSRLADLGVGHAASRRGARTGAEARSLLSILDGSTQ